MKFPLITACLAPFATPLFAQTGPSDARVLEFTVRADGRLTDPKIVATMPRYESPTTPKRRVCSRTHRPRLPIRLLAKVSV